MQIEILFSDAPEVIAFEDETFRFKKQLAYVGEFTNPKDGGKIRITPERLRQWMENSKARDISVILSHPKEPLDYTKNLVGVTEKVRLGKDKKGRLSLYGILRFVEDWGRKIKGKFVKGISVGIKAAKDGKEYLDHLALTTIPHLRDLEGFVAQFSDVGDFDMVTEYEKKKWAKDPRSFYLEMSQDIPKLLDLIGQDIHIGGWEVGVLFDMGKDKDQEIQMEMSFEKQESETFKRVTLEEFEGLSPSEQRALEESGKEFLVL